ncbi:uncharacterized protein CDAR_239661 [Caerostris darwini]|uniref:Uncharacterized protein n=1 Tax=Caerostris darwini TaxID=1538125 RepID=A0AAV4SM86_9ARAC|nr:uncharacterized protein CDAR_239661 [Caerostris darwini]
MSVGRNSFDSAKVDPGSQTKPRSCKESIVPTSETLFVKDRSASTSACFDHLATFLSFEGKCGFCEYVNSGDHSRWNSLDDDAVLFKEVSKNTKWMNKLLFYKLESAVPSKEDGDRVQEIPATDEDSLHEIKGMLNS